VGKLSRDKGAGWERRNCAFLRACGYEADRNLEECRDGNTGDIKTNAPLVVQCKAGKRPNVWQAVREAEEASRDSAKFGIAALHKDQAKPGDEAEEIVAMRAEWWWEIVGLLRSQGVW
jgi:predicted amidohydrolase YtcJ